MRFAFSEEQEELRRSVRRALEQDRLGELGLGGLVIAERHGGAGLGWVEAVAVMEELGRALASTSLLQTWMAATALDDARLLGELARGRTATLLHAPLALDGDLLLAAKGDVAHLVTRARRTAVPTMDATRPLARFEIDELGAPVGDATRALALGRIALAAEQVGVAQACLDRSVEYAKVRHQFGRPIGSFQAIQHTCADMFVRVESARSAAYYAGWAADHAPDELAEVSAIAAAVCGDAAFQVAADTIQVHGGIGFTWEHDAHRYFKRARAARTLLGTPAERREDLARRIL